MCVCVCVCVFVYLIGVDEVESEDSVSKTRVKFDTSLSSVSGISSIQLSIHLYVRYQKVELRYIWEIKAQR